MQSPIRKDWRHATNLPRRAMQIGHPGLRSASCFKLQPLYAPTIPLSGQGPTAAQVGLSAKSKMTGPCDPPLVMG